MGRNGNNLISIQWRLYINVKRILKAGVFGESSGEIPVLMVQIHELKTGAILQYIKAGVDLHAYQAREILQVSCVCRKALQAWPKSRNYGERQRHCQSYQDHSLHSAQDRIYKSIHIINGFSEKKGQLWIPRANACPTESLQKKVFSRADRLSQKVREGIVCEQSISNQAFLQMLKNMRKIILQDGVMFRVENRVNQFFNHSFFSDPELFSLKMPYTLPVRLRRNLKTLFYKGPFQFYQDSVKV
ncbi:hypothetical protein J3Q64DRAFT_1885231 [Phycomyces blakesleeanus]|uniref:Ndc10 domain-containing protein n=1 Tax=Phycomyces blakesleeanus TaxID=4837 RepID=A0ABR3B1J4_PHYBL